MFWPSPAASSGCDGSIRSAAGRLHPGGRPGSLACGTLKVALLALCVLGAGGAHAEGDLLISQAWARPTPPGISVGAVYLNITNKGAAADRLLTVSSPLAERSEIHETTMQAGVMSMHAVTGLACPPGATVKIGPGAVHIMLLGLKQPWSLGSEVPLTLTFEHAGRVSLNVPVQSRS